MKLPLCAGCIDMAAPRPGERACACGLSSGRKDGSAGGTLAAETWIIETVAGSFYRFRRDGAGRWWVCAANIPNPTSASLADGEWEIEGPWPLPPVPGLPVAFRASAGLAVDDPARCPGGGKCTSRVVRAARVIDGAAPTPSAGAEARAS